MCFELDNRSNLRKQVRKAASSQLDKAFKALRPGSAAARSADAAVHTARKRLKEVRALLRLVREGLGGKRFKRENEALREAARPLSEVRDATALVEALQSLEKRYSGTVNKNAFKPVRKALQSRRTAIRRRILLKGRALGKAAAVVKDAAARAEQWPLQGRSWQVLQAGLQRAYERGHRAMTNASRETTDANLHEWRKRAKDLRYQIELLEPLCPLMMEVAAAQAETLTDLLGDDHDLAVLRGFLDTELKETVAGEAAETLKGLIDGRRTDLQHSAMLLGENFFAESPRQFVERVKTYWNAA